MPKTSQVSTDAKKGFVDFYRSEYSRSVRLVFALLGGGDSTEDLVQEAFLRTYVHFGALDNPGGFLRVILVNLCTDAQRSRARARQVQKRISPPQLLSQPASELFDVLLLLPVRQRTALVLRYWADFTEAEIATALGCRPGTVKTLARRGLTRLRKELER